MNDKRLAHLEAQTTQLLSEFDRLVTENQSLKDKQKSWQQERTRLIEKNEMARTRVESMIHRLKSLEANA